MCRAVQTPFGAVLCPPQGLVSSPMPSRWCWYPAEPEGCGRPAQPPPASLATLAGTGSVRKQREIPQTWLLGRRSSFCTAPEPVQGNHLTARLVCAQQEGLPTRDCSLWNRLTALNTLNLSIWKPFPGTGRRSSVLGTGSGTDPVVLSVVPRPDKRQWAQRYVRVHQKSLFLL